MKGIVALPSNAVSARKPMNRIQIYTGRRQPIRDSFGEPAFSGTRIPHYQRSMQIHTGARLVGANG
ncbi:hypothetical protein EMIT0158MI4_230080 [Burkholderia ambifaria]